MPRGLIHILASLLLAAAAARADDLRGDRSNVTLVVNDKSPIARRLAAFYAAWHSLEPKQVCHLSLSEEESVSRADYEKSIAGPLEDCLKRSGRVEKTYYLVLTQGLPLRVLGATGKDIRQVEGASVDSELALLYLVLHGKKPPLGGPLDNPFYRQREQPFGHPAFPIYLVTRLAGYSYEDARRAVERCRGARNIGKVVLDLKADNDEEGNDWLRNAAIVLPENRVILETTIAVVDWAKSVIGYGGWGSNDKQRQSRKSGMEWLPGAIAAEYVSTNARTFKMPPFQWTLGKWSDPSTFFAGSPQSMILDYVWEGVSGVSGYVDEPYLIYTVRPDQLFPAYLGGRNLAESYYLALPVLSWQSLIVGDPLCKLE